MDKILSKKVIVIFSVMLAIVITAIIVAVSTGNTAFPSLSDPDGIFYERLDDNGNVVYTITNQELYDEIKGNDGLDQLLYLIDFYLLHDYVVSVTDEEITDELLKLKYGTSVQAEIDDMTATVRAELEAAFDQSMVLAGYSGNEEAYATIVLARKAYTRFAIDADADNDDMDVAAKYMTAYFDDIKALRIRFTSSADANDVMKQVHLLVYSSSSLREYLGYTFKSETLKDLSNEIVEAYETVDTYYFDTNNNILDLNEDIVYTKGVNDIYTDADSAEYTLDFDGNLLDADLLEVIPAEHIFTSLDAAETFQENATIYYTVTKTDPFDANERSLVKNAANETVYSIDKDGKIYDALNVDITASNSLIVNKVYKDIADVTTTTVNNSSELTAAEVLTKYIQMYNIVYNSFRDEILETETAETLIASDNENLTFNYETLAKTQSSLATYMFKTLDITDTESKPYTVTPKSYTASSSTYYYLVYKLTQPTKYDAYEAMLDLIEDNIKLPAQTIDNLTLPTTGWYSAKITWTSKTAAIIANDGKITKPAVDTDVTLTYKITANGVSRTGDIIVKALASGTTSTVDTTTGEQPTFKTLLANDTLYAELYQGLIDATMESTDVEKTVTTKLVALRTKYGFKVYDRFMAVEYMQADAAFEIDRKGDNTIVASVDGRPNEGAAYSISADDLMQYCLTKNTALYGIYASQYKELIYSTYFEPLFGTQTDASKNRTDKMAEMRTQVTSTKEYYAYLQQMYASYGLDFTFASFNDYAYNQYGTRSELELLQYFVSGALQPYLIYETIDQYNLIELLYDEVSTYYDNYFSLSVSHLILHVDFDENGTPDDYNAYIASLDAQGLEDFDTLVAAMETAINEYLDASTANTYATLITKYNNALRDDATWGAFKQAGILLMTETLDETDDQSVVHSLTYSGDYGVKDKFVPEYVDALIALYQEYRLEQNLTLTKLYSPLVQTEFGLHLILVKKGDDFNQFSAQFAEVNPALPAFSVGSENPDGKPTLVQMNLYAQYFFYSTIYDLADTEIESKYNIVVPNLPASVKTALDFYFGTLVENLFVVGALNINLVDRLVQGEFQTGSYNNQANAALQLGLQEVKNVYYEALFSQYE